MMLKKRALPLLLLGLCGFAHANDNSIDRKDQYFLDSFAGNRGEWIKVSEDIFAAESGGEKTVVYRNGAIKEYIAGQREKLAQEIGKTATARTAKEISVRQAYVDSLQDEITQLEAEQEAAASATNRSTVVVGWDQGSVCGWVLYADAELSFYENLTNSATVISKFDPIGSGPQFAPPPPSLPTRFYRHVRSTIDPSSLGTPINNVASTRSNSAQISATSTDINFWGDACGLSSTRTVSLSGGSCSGVQGAVAVTTRNCSDL